MHIKIINTSSNIIKKTKIKYKYETQMNTEEYQKRGHTGEPPNGTLK